MGVGGGGREGGGASQGQSGEWAGRGPVISRGRASKMHEWKLESIHPSDNPPTHQPGLVETRAASEGLRAESPVMPGAMGAMV